MKKLSKLFFLLILSLLLFSCGSGRRSAVQDQLESFLKDLEPSSFKLIKKTDSDYYELEITFKETLDTELQSNLKSIACPNDTLMFEKYNATTDEYEPLKTPCQSIPLTALEESSEASEDEAVGFTYHVKINESDPTYTDALATLEASPFNPSHYDQKYRFRFDIKKFVQGTDHDVEEISSLEIEAEFRTLPLQKIEIEGLDKTVHLSFSNQENAQAFLAKIPRDDNEQTTLSCESNAAVQAIVDNTCIETFSATARLDSTGQKIIIVETSTTAGDYSLRFTEESANFRITADLFIEKNLDSFMLVSSQTALEFKFASALAAELLAKNKASLISSINKHLTESKSTQNPKCFLFDTSGALRITRQVSHTLEDVTDQLCFKSTLQLSADDSLKLEYLVPLKFGNYFLELDLEKLQPDSHLLQISVSGTVNTSFIQDCPDGEYLDTTVIPSACKFWTSCASASEYESVAPSKTTDRVCLPCPKGICGFSALYTPESFKSNQWKDLSSNAQHATDTGVIKVTREEGTGQQASKLIKYLKGEKTSKITFPPKLLSSSFTLCTVSRWTSDVTAQSSLLSDDKNIFFFGHKAEKAGVASFPTLQKNTLAENQLTNANDWLIMCGQNKGKLSLFTAEQAEDRKFKIWKWASEEVVDVTNLTNNDIEFTANNAFRLSINPNLDSPWEMRTLIIWNRALLEDEIDQVITSLKNELVVDCDSNTQYEFAAYTATSSRVCQDLSVCRAGQYVKTAKTEKSDRECQDCSFGGDYSTADNVSSCINLRTCSAGEFVSKAATTKSNRECQACDSSCKECSAAGSSACTVCTDAKWLDSSTCNDLTACSPGQYESVAPTTTSNRECQACDLSCKECSAAGSSACTACTAAEWLDSSTCQIIRDECTASSNIGKSWQPLFQTAAPTATSDRQCAAVTECSHYEIAAPTRTTNKVCGHYMISNNVNTRSANCDTLCATESLYKQCDDTELTNISRRMGSNDSNGKYVYTCERAIKKIFGYFPIEHWTSCKPGPAHTQWGGGGCTIQFTSEVVPTRSSGTTTPTSDATTPGKTRTQGSSDMCNELTVTCQSEDSEDCWLSQGNISCSPIPLTKYRICACKQ